MPPSEGYVTTSDGVRLFFRKLGTGLQTVMIPNAGHMFDSFRCLADHRTIIFFDLRNRGASDSVSDSSKLAKGIQHDVDDLEAVQFWHVDVQEQKVERSLFREGQRFPAVVRQLHTVAAAHE